MFDENGNRDAAAVPTGQADLSGATAAVTGSSSGIGRAIALELARAGADVVIHARQNRTAAEETAHAIRQLSRQSHVILADLTHVEQQDELARQVCLWRGVPDIWVNNAGADVLTGEAAHWTFEDKLQYLWQVDVLATVRLSRTIGQRMKQQRRGVVLNIGWDQAEHGMGGESGELFATIKGAVMAFTKSLAQSLAPAVRVNGIAPGWIKTAWGEQATDYWQQRARQESLLQRWGTPEDVARVVHFLASPAASFVTGQTIAVNGGYRFGSSDGSP